MQVFKSTGLFLLGEIVALVLICFCAAFGIGFVRDQHSGLVLAALLITIALIAVEVYVLGTRRGSLRLMWTNQSLQFLRLTLVVWAAIVWPAGDRFRLFVWETIVFSLLFFVAIAGLAVCVREWRAARTERNLPSV